MDPPQPSPATAVAAAAATVSRSASPSNSPSCTKLRLLCSFGGRIVPRPHDKALCYAGGETRLLAVDRRTAASSFSSLTSHISRTLLNGRPFCLKYQLPDHDLDSLVSVATDEDLANMFDEYDRASLSSNHSRLRFFLFPAPKAEPAGGDYDPRSEAWFFDALRSAGISVDGKRTSESGSGGDGMVEFEGKSGAAVDSSPGTLPISSLMSADSVSLETSSSLGSARSAVSNLPSIRVGAGDEFGAVHAQDLKHNQSLVDSLESESSATSPNFQSPTLVYLDAPSHSDSKDSKHFTNSVEADNIPSDACLRTEKLNAMQAYGYSLSQAMDQMPHPPSTAQASAQPHLQPQPQTALQAYPQLHPQYIHAGPQFVAQYYSSAVQAAAYPTTYQPYLQQQQQQPQQQAAYQLNNYPVYLMHIGQPQAHDMPVPCDMATATSIPSSHPQLLSNPPMIVTPPVVYEGGFPTDLGSKVYRPTASQPISVQPVSVPSEDHKSQILAVAQISQTQPVSVVDGANFGGATEFEDPLHAQIYKTQPTVQAVASQRQPTTNAATAMLLDNLTQLQLDSTK